MYSDEVSKCPIMVKRIRPSLRWPVPVMLTKLFTTAPRLDWLRLRRHSAWDLNNSIAMLTQIVKMCGYYPMHYDQSSGGRASRYSNQLRNDSDCTSRLGPSTT